MDRRWTITIVAIVAFVGIAIAMIVGDETPCASFPLCPVTSDGFWAAMAFFAAAAAMGTIRAVAGPGRSTGPPPTD